MADKAPAYQWYPKDYDTDEAVKLMSYEQEGIYRRLLDHQWLHGSIPAESRQIAGLLPKVPRAKFLKLWLGISEKFQPISAGRIANARLERQRGEQSDFHETKSAGGRASVEARRLKFGTAQPFLIRTDSEQPFEQPVQAGPEPSSASSSSSSSSTPSPEEHVPAGEFDRFWAIYPNKVGKDAARKAWFKRRRDLPPIDALLEVVDRQIGSSQWTKDGGQYIPNPATWLNQGRWQDEVAGPTLAMVSDRTRHNAAGSSEALRLIAENEHARQ